MVCGFFMTLKFLFSCLILHHDSAGSRYRDPSERKKLHQKYSLIHDDSSYVLMYCLTTSSVALNQEKQLFLFGTVFLLAL